MAEDRPWLFPQLATADFDMSASIPVVRPREVDGPPHEYRVSLTLMALKIIEGMNLSRVPTKHRIGNVTGNTINLPGGVTTDINRLEVYINGLLIDWEVHPDLTGFGVTMDVPNRQINIAIGLQDQYVLIKEY